MEGLALIHNKVTKLVTGLIVLLRRLVWLCNKMAAPAVIGGSVLVDNIVIAVLETNQRSKCKKTIHGPLFPQCAKTWLTIYSMFVDESFKNTLNSNPFVRLLATREVTVLIYSASQGKPVITAVPPSH